MSRLHEVVDTVMESTVVPSFSRIGIAVRSRSSDWPDADQDLTGRVVLITGATSGIGYAAAREVARRGAAVRTVGRSADRGEDAVARLRTESGNDDIRFDEVDMGNFDAIESYAAAFTEREQRLDVVVHNAGALFPDRRETESGVETTLAVHLLGPYILTRGLEPLLAESAPSRVIWMSSGGMYTASLDLDRLEYRTDEHYDGRKAYAKAKRAQVVLNELLSVQYAASPISGRISSVAMHPGWVRTPGVSAGLPLFDKVMRPLLRTPSEGADTLVWLISGGGTNGGFYLDRKIRPTHKTKRTRVDPDDRSHLIDWIEARITEATG